MAVEEYENVEPMPGEKIVHRYGDILECDNRLPNWWLMTLYGAIAFGVFYWFQYHVLHASPSSQEAFQRDMAADYAAAAARARRAGAMTPEALRVLSRDPATVSAGRAVFMQNCVACHGPNGGGLIGPNLTDNAWLHGGSPERVYRTVLEGVTAKGMPAWGPQLGESRVQSVVAFLLTVRNTNVAGGKAPQGTVEE